MEDYELSVGDFFRDFDNDLGYVVEKDTDGEEIYYYYVFGSEDMEELKNAPHEYERERISQHSINELGKTDRLNHIQGKVTNWRGRIK